MNSALSSNEKSVLTQQAFHRLLACFDSDPEHAGEKYEILRRKLVKFFEWRACGSAALDLADETINRVARRLIEGEIVRNLSNYAYGVARMVYLERMKELKREEAARESVPTHADAGDTHEKERLECFETCLNKLSDESRELIVTYYREQRRAKIKLRKELAGRLGIPLNALRIRAHRIRTKLEECVVNCLQQSQGALKLVSATLPLVYEVIETVMPKVEDDNLAKQYLLGELSEHDLAKVEEEYFEDDEVFGQLSAVEDDLIDAYALDQLSTSDRKRFEERLLLSSAQRERLKFARTLLRTASGAQEIKSNIPPLIPTASWWMSPFTFLRTLNPIVSVSAAAMLILAILTGWWLIHRSNVRRSQEQQAHQQTNPPSTKQGFPAINQNAQQASQLPSPINQPKQQEPKQEPAPRMQSNRTVTFALVEGVVRDLGESNRLVIPSDASMVRLNVTIERSEYRTYLADLRRAEGDKVWQRGGIYPDSVTSGKGTIVLLVPAAVLKNGDYILTLSGTGSRRTEVVGEYSFRIVRN